MLTEATESNTTVIGKFRIAVLICVMQLQIFSIFCEKRFTHPRPGFKTQYLLWIPATVADPYRMKTAVGTDVDS